MNHYQSIDPDHSLFDTLISPFYEDIKKYCISLASSPWEAEDLLQDTLMKSYIALKKNPERPLSKRFFYQIAKHTLIDQKRKKSLPTESLSEHHVDLADLEDKSHPINVRETLEILAEYLSIKQFVIILLIDVFQFTAKETARMIKDSESNVHTTLHRSRKKLNRYAYLSPDETSKFYKLKQSNKQKMTSNLFESFMKGFQSKSVNLIYEAYLASLEQGIQIEKINRDKTSICFRFTDPDGNVFMVCQVPG